MFGRDLPATVLLDQWQPVWGIAIDLVRAAEDERCLGTMLTSCLEQRECAVGMDEKVDAGITRGPIMRRLCRCMDYNGKVSPPDFVISLSLWLLRIRHRVDSGHD